MRTLSSTIQQEMHRLNQRGNWRRLYAIVEDSSTTRYLTDHVEAVTYQSQQYDPYPIVIGERTETIRPESAPFEVSVANIDGSFAVGLENGGYRGQKITITEFYIAEDGTIEAAYSGTFRILGAQVSPNSAFVTLGIGMPDLFSQSAELPRHRWMDDRCPFAYRDPLTCAYARNEFGAVNEQDLFIGGDGVKILGWRFLNSTSVTSADIHTTNNGQLTIVIPSTTNVSANKSPPDAPFLYRLFDAAQPGMSLDFDIHVKTAGSITEDFEGEGLMITSDSDTPTDHIIVGKRWNLVTATLGTYGQQYGDGAPTSYFSPIDSSNLYLRMTKVGSTFTAYERASESAAWTTLGSKSRPDMDGVSLRIGVYSETGSATRGTAFTSKFDYIRIVDGGFSECNRLDTDCRQRENFRRFGGAVGILHGPLEL